MITPTDPSSEEEEEEEEEAEEAEAEEEGGTFSSQLMHTINLCIKPILYDRVIVMLILIL